MGKTRQWTIILLVMILVFAVFLVCCFSFVSYIRHQDEAQVFRYLQDITQQRRDAVLQQVNGDLQLLRGIAITLSMADMPEDQWMTGMLERINLANEFVRMGLAKPDGLVDVVDIDGSIYRNIDISGMDFFARAMAGHEVVSGRTYEAVTGEYVIYCAVPLWRDGVVARVLTAAHTEATLLKLVDLPVFFSHGYYAIVDGKGSVIAGGRPPVVEDHILLAHADGQDKQVVALREALRTATPGTFSITQDGAEQIIAVSPLKVNGWSVVSVVERANVVGAYNEVVIGALVMTALSSVLILSLLYLQSRTLYRNHTTLTELAYIDRVTGISNYVKFQMDAQTLLEENPGVPFAVWTFDTKSFSDINAIFGTEIGDRVLRRVANVLGQDAPPLAAHCRVSGDMFAGIRPYKTKAELEDWFWHVIAILGEREVIAKNLMRIDDAMGVFCIDEFPERVPITDMVNMATIARREAKLRAGNAFSFFSLAMWETQRRQTELEAAGPEALRHGELTFFLQPKIALKDGYRVVSAEVLMRWKHGTHGFIMPSEFIPVFERSGFIVEVDRYIFEEACKWYVHTRSVSSTLTTLAINVSRQALLRSDFVSHYTAVKNRYGIADGVLELEFTESVLLENYEPFLEAVTALEQNGFVCAIDDFGSGYSSLNVLKSIPIDVLKLDALFFRGNQDDGRDRVVVSNFVNMARELDIKTVAEGVEDVDQVAFLEKTGCDMIQGYVFAKPMDQEAFAEMLRSTGGRMALPGG